MSNTSDFRAESLYNVTGWTALVTGGGSGLGLIAAQALAANGARVYITGRRLDKLEEAAQSLGPDSPGSIIAIQGDITKKEDIQALVEHISSKEKSLNFLINNAGIKGIKNDFNKVEQTPEAISKSLFEGSQIQEWQDVLLLNTSAMYFVAAAFLPLLVNAKDTHGNPGSILNISSMSGITKQSQGGQFSYNAAKAATISLSQQLAYEFSRPTLNVRVNNLAPGYFPSEMTRPSQFPGTPEEIRAQRGIPVGRLGTAREYAQAVLGFAVNTYVNGATLIIDGGWLLAQS
ncbi:NAD(P)-binding protein [Sistotremastrum suecicum HHB10207 ss-3]|uniref:NAD(P)-binding protein n=1 Tax=Sistotremastrum suecicum HHB10207 ss-3 TaxID=1314776 RepID=A0A166DY72_9AGAM|nr:NAD(P)-binding protein [Sistotremastrum suecicum HHB10207 ss-3]